MSSVVSSPFCYPTFEASLMHHFSHLPRNTQPQHLTRAIMSDFLTRHSHEQPDSARPALSHLISSTLCAFISHGCLFWHLSSRRMLLKEYCAQQGSGPDSVCRRVSNFSRLTFGKDVQERFTLVCSERLHHLMVREVTWLWLSDSRAA